MLLALALLIALLLMALSALIHYEALRFVGRLMMRSPIRPRQRVLVAVGVCMAAHLAAIALYALAFAVVTQFPALGAISGDFVPGMQDFVYFAFTCYTTLGIGDIWPEGPLRIVAGVAALNGFVMITWSASFTYLTMQRHWHPERGE